MTPMTILLLIDIISSTFINYFCTIAVTLDIYILCFTLFVTATVLYIVFCAVFALTTILFFYTHTHVSYIFI